MEDNQESLKTSHFGCLNTLVNVFLEGGGGWWVLNWKKKKQGKNTCVTKPLISTYQETPTLLATSRGDDGRVTLEVNQHLIGKESF